MSASKKNDRIYLREEETKVLQSLLQEWSDKTDKKNRDAFVSGTALPKIQDQNAKEYGPEGISTNKVAKVQWEKRVTVSHFKAPFFVMPTLCLDSRRFTRGSRITNLSRTGRYSSLKGRSHSGGLWARRRPRRSTRSSLRRILISTEATNYIRAFTSRPLAST